MFASREKPSLIDLEALQGDRAQASSNIVQRDRLSEKGGYRLCKGCNQHKSISEFYSRGGTRKDMQYTCNDCNAKRAREFRQKSRDRVSEYKLNKGCEVCGFKAEHSCQLDLDHIDPETKTYKGSHKSYDAGWSWKRIEDELAKCVVTCKNCHALRTYKEQHWKNEHTTIRMRQSGLVIAEAVTDD